MTIIRTFGILTNSSGLLTHSGLADVAGSGDGYHVSSTNYSGLSVSGSYFHTQAVASDTWVITHNLNQQYPDIACYNSSNQIERPSQITGTDVNTLTLTFAEAISGYAFLVATNMGAGVIAGGRVWECQVLDNSSSVLISTIQYWNVPSLINGLNLIRAQSRVVTAGTSGATTIQVRNMTKYPSNDSLSSAISIASGDTLGTVGAIDTSYDDVSTDDLIKVYVTGVSTTAPLGLIVVLEFG